MTRPRIQFGSVSSLPSDPLFGPLSQAERFPFQNPLGWCSAAPTSRCGLRGGKKTERSSRRCGSVSHALGSMSAPGLGLRPGGMASTASVCGELRSALEMNPLTELTPLPPLRHPLAHGSCVPQGAECAKPEQHSKGAALGRCLSVRACDEFLRSTGLAEASGEQDSGKQHAALDRGRDPCVAWL